MQTISYSDAVNGALDRLRPTGFYIDDLFANHAPMAAEALARLGYCDEVDGWLDANIEQRNYGPLPDPSTPIDDWRTALGDRSRGGDWVELFRTELAGMGWRQVLQTWWPRLLPGCAGSLTHGLIRTAHAVRSLSVGGSTDLQIDELARGLAFWATVFAPLATAIGGHDRLAMGGVDDALSGLTAEYAGHYTATAPRSPVPLIHTVTAPAAMRLALAELPAELHGASLATMVAVNREIFVRFGGRRLTAISEPTDGGRPDFPELAAKAVDTGDEHAIKMCEAAAREYAFRPDPRYFTAAATAVALIRRR